VADSYQFCKTVELFAAAIAIEFGVVQVQNPLQKLDEARVV
jgi:hypothetical protein